MNAPAQLAPLTHATVTDLIPKMLPGQILVYHIGSLMFDRLRGPMCLTVNGVALAAYDAYKRGEVTLVQHKIAPLQYEYIAIKLPQAGRNAARGNESPRDQKVLGRKDGRDLPAGRSAGPPAPALVEIAEGGARSSVDALSLPG